MTKKMTKAQASAEAVRRWGKTGSIRDRGRSCPTDPAVRAQARETLRSHEAMRPEQPDLRDTVKWSDDTTLREFRRAMLEYRDAYQVWKARKDELFSLVTTTRFQVGDFSHGMFFVRGSGDSWEEAFAKVDGK